MAAAATSKLPEPLALDRVPSGSSSCARDEFISTLSTDYVDVDDRCFFHGRAFRGAEQWGEILRDPHVTWASDEKPRDDHAAPEWLTASEFCDTKATMNIKVELLARLLRMSRRTVIYSGAGISVAAGIGQAARGTATGRASTDASPTFTHLALGALARAGYIHSWEQQNHDGLPQKAGVPQELVNEIHGSWYDPSNPVVKYSGNLKNHNYEWMERDANTADLVLVLGTSLGGLNADQIATNCAHRSCEKDPLGFVHINLQQTDQDGKATLRIFDKTDSVFKLLLTHMGMTLPTMRECVGREPPKDGWRAKVPYDRHGRRLTDVDDTSAWTWLDLRRGARIRLTNGHNCVGSRQPQFMHIGAKKSITRNGSTIPPGKGRGVVVSHNPNTAGLRLNIDGTNMLLGAWWLEAAKRGGPALLPVVNCTVSPGASTRKAKPATG